MLKLSQLSRALAFEASVNSGKVPDYMARYGSHRSYNPVTSAVGKIGTPLPPLRTEIDPITGGIRGVAPKDTNIENNGQ